MSPSKRADPYYLSAAWRALRAEALLRDCGRCVIRGCGRPATRVDHIVVRKDGGPDALANLRSLCADHDNQAHREKPRGRTHSREARFVVRGAGPDGRPLDPNHPWNR